MKMRTFLYFSLILSGGCASYTAVGPGEITRTGLIVQTGRAWNQAPISTNSMARPGSTIWTQDGLLLDRIMIIPAVPSGEPLFRQSSQWQALPVFKAAMLANEIEELTESSIVKLFGEGGVVVQTSHLRPHRYGENWGILFDMELTIADGPGYKGVTGALVVNEKLYLIFFLGAEPYYYQRHLGDALEVIKSARVVTSS